MTTDARRSAPSALRNRDAILDVARRYLPATGLVLEVASGTGEHVSHFASALPSLVFQPTDADADARASVDAWCAGLPNVRPALDLNASADLWPVYQADAVVCINMIHIAPWAATLGLIRGAGRCLKNGSPLILYGPFRRGGRHTAPTNAEFDESLRARNPEWGVRELEKVADVAAASFNPPVIEPMPANNLCVIFRRR